jgi:hypothetical protein
VTVDGRIVVHLHEDLLELVKSINLLVLYFEVVRRFAVVKAF